MKGQIGRFVLVGLLCTLVDAGLHYAIWFGAGLSRVVPSASSDLAFGLLKVFTYVTGMVVGFYGNRTWTFRSTGEKKRQAGRFAFVSLFALCVNALCSAIASHAAGGGRVGWLAGMLTGSVIAAAVSFTGHRRWTFAAGL